MAYRSKFAIAIISAAVAFYAILGVVFGWSSINAQQPINDPGAQIRIFESVLQHIQNDYVDEPDLEKVRNGAMRGLADGLDPYSSYLTAEQVKTYRSVNGEKKVGIGAVFSQVSYLYVISVVKGSPADQAGMLAGDVIEYIESKATRDISLYDAEQMIMGTPGSKVKFRVFRPRAKPFTLEVTRGTFAAPEPLLEMKDGVAHLKVFSLAKGESVKIKEAISGLQAKGVKKIILDLRKLALGEIAEAVEVANLFVKSGKLATVIGRESKVLRTYEAVDSKHIYDGDVVALVDLGTAGPGEVVASALLENKRAEVVGEKTFGAGTVQQLFTLSGGDGFLLTKSKWGSPNGVAFLSSEKEKRGVKPSVEVKRAEAPELVEIEELIDGQESNDELKKEDAPKPLPKSKEDIQLKKAFEVINGKTKAAAK
jgi:carboxyl-terminal processing protease